MITDIACRIKRSDFLERFLCGSQVVSLCRHCTNQGTVINVGSIIVKWCILCGFPSRYFGGILRQLALHPSCNPTQNGFHIFLCFHAVIVTNSYVGRSDIKFLDDMRLLSLLLHIFTPSPAYSQSLLSRTADHAFFEI